MDTFNIIAGICSVAGLVFSIIVARRTFQINKTVNQSVAYERFTANYDQTMAELKSTGLNAIRKDFPNSDLKFEFQKALLTYRNSYTEIFSKEELDTIAEMLELISQDDFDESRYKYLLANILSKPKHRR